MRARSANTKTNARSFVASLTRAKATRRSVIDRADERQKLQSLKSALAHRLSILDSLRIFHSVFNTEFFNFEFMLKLLYNAAFIHTALIEAN